MMQYGTIITALEFLKENQSYKVGDLRLSIDKNNVFNVTGWSNCIHMENVTREIALNELNEIKSLFNDMLLASSDLGNFISNKKLKFNLAFDYGKGGIGICSEFNDLINWEAMIK